MAKTAEKWSNCDYFAEYDSARHTARPTGNVLIVSRTWTNGKARAAIATPHNRPTATPVVTWVTPDYLARKCRAISEAAARAHNPEMFAKVERFDRDPAYRAYVNRAKSPLQRADGTGVWVGEAFYNGTQGRG